MNTKSTHETAAHPVMLMPQQALWLELMQFYIREAWLLDERKYKEWLDLFTDDVLYFMPRRKNVPRRELHRELTPLGELGRHPARPDRGPLRRHRDHAGREPSPLMEGWEGEVFPAAQVET